jgi:hypothetical protein
MLLKDVHLVEAALYTDSPVASNDSRARRGFALVARNAYSPLRAVKWFNPCVDDYGSLLGRTPIAEEFQLVT